MSGMWHIGYIWRNLVFQSKSTEYVNYSISVFENTVKMYCIFYVSNMHTFYSKGDQILFGPLLLLIHLSMHCIWFDHSRQHPLYTEYWTFIIQQLYGFTLEKERSISLAFSYICSEFICIRLENYIFLYRFDYLPLEQSMSHPLPCD